MGIVLCIKKEDIYGQNAYVSFQRTDIIHISNNTFYYNRFSAGNSKSMGRFEIQLLVPNGQWFSKYYIDKNTNYSSTTTEWNLLNIDFTETNHGIKLVYDQIDKALADMCFENLL